MTRAANAAAPIVLLLLILFPKPPNSGSLHFLLPHRNFSWQPPLLHRSAYAECKRGATSEAIDSAGVSGERVPAFCCGTNTLSILRHVSAARQCPKRFLDVAQPPILTSCLERREPCARKIQQHNRQHPHAVNKRQAMAVAGRIRLAKNAPCSSHEIGW